MLLKQAFPLKNRTALALVKGTFLYADLSGFTAISDRLSASGRLGAEELASAINSIFDPLLDIIFSRGGDVIKFGGDSALVFFEGKGRTSKAISCGRALLDALGPGFSVNTSLGEFPISIHVGISQGKAYSMITGKKGCRYDHLFCGPDVSGAYRAADSAGAGEMFLAENCPIDSLESIKNKRMRRSAFGGTAEAKRRTGKSKLDSKPSPALNVARFMASDVWELCANKRSSGVEGEHRPLTTMFIGLDGLYSNLDRSRGRFRSNLRVLNEYISGLFEITAKFGGNIVRLDVASFGEKILVLFGAPKLRENAPADALKAALEIMRSTAEYSMDLAAPLKIKIGVNSGVSYVGDVGGSYRREYTAMGKDVNLAARLMSRAEWGEILAGRATVHAARNEFEVMEKGTTRLKGIESPITLLAVQGLKGSIKSSRVETELVGRDEEIAGLHRAISGIAGGDGGIVTITGEAGCGKSVLMERALDELNRFGAPVLKTACFEHLAGVPLAPLADIIRESVGISAADEKAERIEKLAKALEKNRLLEWESLVCRLAGYTRKPSLEINNLTENAKRERTFQVIFALISDYFSARVGCIVIDDLHWSDATSVDFLAQFGKIFPSKRVGMILVSRTSEVLPRLEGVHSIQLGSLSESAGVKLFNSIAGDEIDPGLVREIVRSSGGNPFYLEETAKAVRDAGVEYWTEKKGIPDSVERVITARIDRLDDMVKTTIRTASVIGRVFGLNELSEIFEPRNEIPRIPDYLDMSSKLDITPLQQSEPRVEYRFKHVLTREVAYSGLSFKSRRALHKSLAEYYRKVRLKDGIEPELIGHHYENSDATKMAAPYYLRAGLDAARAFSNSEAIQNLEKAIELLEPAGHDNLACRAHLGLGRVYRLIGKYDDSESHLRIVIGRNRPGRHWKKEALKELSDLFRIKSEFKKAGEVLSEILDMTAEDPGLKAVYQNGMGDIARRKGDLELAVERFSEGLQFSDNVGPDFQAQILNNMGISLWMLGRLDEAISMYNRAAENYKSRKDLQGIAKISNNMGIIFEQKGDLLAASQYYREAAEVFERIGDRRAQGYCYGNLATNFLVRGLPSASKTYIDKALVLFEDIDERLAYAMTIGNLSDWYHFIGDKEAERQNADRALKLAADLGNEELVCETKIRLGRFVNGANIAESLAMLKQAGEQAKAGKWHDLELKSEYYLCEWEVLFGESGNIRSLIERLGKIKVKEPPPEIMCGIERLIGLLNYREGRNTASRDAFRRAFKVAAKSDLVCDRLEIRRLYKSFFPHGVRNFDGKLRIITDRILEGLDEQTASRLTTRLRRRIDLYLSKAVKDVDWRKKTGKIARLLHSR